MVVDIERGRTIKGWKPRRLGGGKGGRKSHFVESTDNRIASIDDDERVGTRRPSSRDRERERDRDRDRNGTVDRSERRRSKEKEKRSRSRSRSKDRKKRSKSRGTKELNFFF